MRYLHLALFPRVESLSAHTFLYTSVAETDRLCSRAIIIEREFSFVFALIVTSEALCVHMVLNLKPEGEGW